MAAFTGSPFARKLCIAAATHPVTRFGVQCLERIAAEPPNLLRVATYHRIAATAPQVDARGDYPGAYSTTAEGFRRQIEMLANDFRPVRLEQVLWALEHGKSLPPRSVLVTFDDAYADFRDVALPILQRCDVPCTLFVPTAFPGDPARAFWWDRLHQAIAGAADGVLVEIDQRRWRLTSQAKRDDCFRYVRTQFKQRSHADATRLLEEVCRQTDAAPAPNRVLSWESLRRLPELIELGGHSHTHPLLHRMTPSDAEQEIERSLDRLSSAVGRTPRAFAYPDGGHSPEVIDAARRCGVRVAFTTRRGMNSLAHVCPLQLNRVNVGRRSDANLLRAQFAAPLRGLLKLTP